MVGYTDNMNESQIVSKVSVYSTANNQRAILEIILSLLGYFGFLYLLYFSFAHQMWMWYIPACIGASLFMVKIFTVQHDCGHNSLFSKTKLNTWTGRILSMVTTMPFVAWRDEHADHHSHVVDIERIQHGDILLLTVEQFRNLPTRKKIAYKVFRHPLFILLIAPFLYFFIKSKYPAIKNRDNILSVFYTNIFVFIIYGSLLVHLGFWTVVFVFAPAAYLGGIIGIGLFYIQHDYPGSQWFKTETWNNEKASLEGSSLLILPQPFDWLTHTIGYHHIHHLDSKIAGYRLKECYKNVTEVQKVKPLTYKDVIDSFRLKLWSHEKRSLIDFREFESVSY